MGELSLTLICLNVLCDQVVKIGLKMTEESEVTNMVEDPTIVGPGTHPT